MLDVCGVDFKKGFWRYHGVNMAIHVEVPSHGKVLPRMSWRWTRSLQATRPGLSLGVPGTSGKLCLFGWFWLVVSTCVKYGVIMCYFHFFQPYLTGWPVPIFRLKPSLYSPEVIGGVPLGRLCYVDVQIHWSPETMVGSRSLYLENWIRILQTSKNFGPLRPL